MAGFFSDSSAIVKRYVNETGSNFVDSLAAVNSGNGVQFRFVPLDELLS